MEHRGRLARPGPCARGPPQAARASPPPAPWPPPGPPRSRRDARPAGQVSAAAAQSRRYWPAGPGGATPSVSSCRRPPSACRCPLSVHPSVSVHAPPVAAAVMLALSAPTLVSVPQVSFPRVSARPVSVLCSSAHPDSDVVSVSPASVSHDGPPAPVTSRQCAPRHSVSAPCQCPPASFTPSEVTPNQHLTFPSPSPFRSEERRVGKECLRLCRSRWSPDH